MVVSEGMACAGSLALLSFSLALALVLVLVVMLGSVMECYTPPSHRLQRESVSVGIQITRPGL